MQPPMMTAHNHGGMPVDACCELLERPEDDAALADPAVDVALEDAAAEAVLLAVGSASTGLLTSCSNLLKN